MPKVRAGTHRKDVTIIQVKDPLCAQTDPEIFFPSDSLNNIGSSPKPAKEICSKCDYTLQCLLTALGNKEEYGVWGGSTPRERKSIRTKGQAVNFVQKLKRDANK